MISINVRDYIITLWRKSRRILYVPPCLRFSLFNMLTRRRLRPSCYVIRGDSACTFDSREYLDRMFAHTKDIVWPRRSPLQLQYATDPVVNAM